MNTEDYKKGYADARLDIQGVIDTYLKGTLSCDCAKCTAVKDKIKKAIDKIKII